MFNPTLARLTMVFLLSASAACAVTPSNAGSDAPGSPAAGHRRYGAWRSAELGGGGYLQQVHFCPSDPRRLYLTSDVGGFYRSDDRGLTWRMLHGGMPSDAGGDYCRGLRVDPANADRFLVAVDKGLYRSHDAGATFTRVLEARFHGNNDARNHGHILVGSPSNPAILLAASDDRGLFRSTDSGVTWSLVFGQVTRPPSAIVFDQSIPGRVWFCVAGAVDPAGQRLTGVWRSEDSGATWTHIAHRAPSEFVPDPEEPATLYGLIDQRPVRSRDGGATWQRFEAGLPETHGGAREDGLYAAIAAHQRTIALGGHGGHFYTLDRGRQRWVKVDRAGVEEGRWWGRMRPGMHQHFGSALGYLAINPRDGEHWLFTDWYALYQSRDAGRTWTLTIDGIELTVFHGVTQDPASPDRVHAGMADVGYFRSDDAGDSFRWRTEGISNNIRSISATPARAGRLYAVGPVEWQWHCNQVFISDNGGDSWRRSPMTGLPEMKDLRCNTVAAHPGDADHVYLTVSGGVARGAGGVYRSEDGGQTWAWMGRGLPETDHLFRNHIWVHGPELAVSGDGSLAAISIDRGRLFRFDEQAGRWESVSPPNGPGGPFAIFADPHQDGRFHLCMKEGGLYRSDDAGRTWFRMLDRPAFWLGTDTVNPGRLALVTQSDILLSLNDGRSWATLDRSLPYRRMRNQVCFAGDRVVVGTGGNGAFWTTIADAPVPEIRSHAIPPIGPRAGPADLGLDEQPLIQNGQMEDGDATPSGWSLSDYRQGTLRLSRDTEVFHGGKAALRLRTEGKAAGFVHQMLQPIPRGPFTVGGVARLDGRLEQAQVAVQVFDSQWKQLEWKPVAVLDTAKTDWVKFQATLSLPEKAAYALLGLSINGDGSAWLDDVTALRRAAEGSRDSAAAAAAQPLPVVVAANHPRIRYVGRWDDRVPTSPRATWSHAGIRLRFRGHSINALLSEGQYQVVVDGRDAGRLITRSGHQRYRLAEGLTPGEHTVELWKRTEPCFGTVTFGGIELPDGGELLEPVPRTRLIEVIGDSVTSGHGNEGTDPRQKFGPETQNAWLAFGAVAARMLDADYRCVAWSARKMWPNDTLPEIYGYTIPQEKVSWDFRRPRPDVVVVTLGANDFRQGPPDREGWVAAYVKFLQELRGHYPDAQLVAASAPTLAGGWRKTQIDYLQEVVRARQDAGDARVRLLTFSEPPEGEGLGANYHPSLRTHRRLAGELARAIAEFTEWPVKPIEQVLQKAESSGRDTATSRDLPQSVAPDDPRLRYLGRFIRQPDGGMRCAWPHSSLRLRVRADAVDVRIDDAGKNRIQVLIDGEPTRTIQLESGSRFYPIARDLPTDREHDIELVRATEALFGELTFSGIRIPEGGVLHPVRDGRRRIEIYGDSISAGFGVEAPDQTHPFSPASQNAALTYGSIAARRLDADLHVIAWSGKTLWPDNSLLEVHHRVLPAVPDSRWDPAKADWSPDVILINLGTNDFAGGNPEERGWVRAYIDLIAALRERHPGATIYAAVGPMLTDAYSPSKNALTTINRYLARVVSHYHDAGDRRVRLLRFEPQSADDGFGAQWHPSRKTHQIMAEKLVNTLSADLGWRPLTVGTDFPGGNAVIDSIAGNTIRLRPDLRDTDGPWFYWSVRIRGAAGRSLNLEFTEQSPLGDRGPALSLDGGMNWRWLGRQNQRRDRLLLSLPAAEQGGDDAILSVGMNYTRSAWDRFLATIPTDAPVQPGTLANTRKGRQVPTLRLGPPQARSDYRLLLTARSHACEMMASYVLEGFLRAILADDEVGRWYRSSVTVLAVPFMDTDGVEDGDQGKNRRPRDHNRDMAPPHVHVETAALVELGRTFFDGKPAAAIDLHCPWLHGPGEEVIFQPGQPNPEAWARQQRFAGLLERHHTGPLPYRAENDLPFGKGWNTNQNYREWLSIGRWAAGQPGVTLATTFETPYATASGQAVTDTSARAFGRDLAVALRLYLTSKP